MIFLVVPAGGFATFSYALFTSLICFTDLFDLFSPYVCFMDYILTSMAFEIFSTSSYTFSIFLGDFDTGANCYALVIVFLVEMSLAEGVDLSMGFYSLDFLGLEFSSIYL